MIVMEKMLDLYVYQNINLGDIVSLGFTCTDKYIKEFIKEKSADTTISEFNNGIEIDYILSIERDKINIRKHIKEKFFAKNINLFHGRINDKSELEKILTQVL